MSGESQSGPTAAGLGSAAQAVYDAVGLAGAQGVHVGQIRDSVAAAGVCVSDVAVRQILVRCRDAGLVERVGRGLYRRVSAEVATDTHERLTYELVTEPISVTLRVPVVQVNVGDSASYRVWIEPVQLE